MAFAAQSSATHRTQPLQSSTRRSFQQSHGALLGSPASRTSTGLIHPHEVTQRSVDRSWASLTSPLKTFGLTPSAYSAEVEAQFREETQQRRIKDLVTSTASVRREAKRRKQGEAMQLRQQPSLQKGGKGGIPRARSSIEAEVASMRSSTRTADVPGRPRLEAPTRSFSGTAQRYDYEYRGSGFLRPLPNPALAPPVTITPELLRTAFPWSSRATHHVHEINPHVKAGYFSVQQDDRFVANAYQPYQVEVVNTARPRQNQTAEEEEGDRAASAASAAASSSPVAMSLGYGTAHATYKQYIHHSAPRDFAQDPSGPIARAAGAQGKILFEVAPHLIEHVQRQQQVEQQEENGVVSGQGLALAVPYKLARFVPLDPRDGQGQSGHLNASGLGYGKGHRNFYKYIMPNVEGNPELAYFRSNHCT